MSYSAGGPTQAGTVGPVSALPATVRRRRLMSREIVDSRRPAGRRRLLSTLTPYLFISVAVGLLLLLTYLPAANMLWYSLNNWSGLGPVDDFVGVDNYLEVFTSPEIFGVFGVSLYYFVGSFVQMALALYFAALLSSSTRFSSFFRGVLFFPYLINGVAIGFVFLYLFQPGGTLDSVLSWFGVANPPQWLGNPDIANFSLAGTSVWRYTGMNFVLFLGAIQSIPTEYLRGSRAGWRQQMAAVPVADSPGHPADHRALVHPLDRGLAVRVRDPLHHDRRRQRHVDLRHQDHPDRFHFPSGGARVGHGGRAADHRAAGDLDPAKNVPRREGRDVMTTATQSRRMASPARIRVTRALTGTGKYGSLIVAVLVIVIPLSVLFIASFKTSKEFGQTGPFQMPQSWLNFDNFIEAFQQGGMVQGFINTTIVLVISLAGTIAIGTMAAYAIDRFQFRGKKLIVALFLIATLIPGVTSQVATFQIIAGLGLYNTMWSLILLFMGTDIISIYIFIQFMQSIPVSLDEAAMIDGANRWTIYWRVILPLLKPAIATVVIIKGIAIYNEFYLPFLYWKSGNLISTALFRFKGPYGAHWETIAAATVLVIVPTLVAFLLLQRFIYRGMTSGAVK